MGIIGKLKRKLGFLPNNTIPKDLEVEHDFLSIYSKCKPYTMTSIERMFSLYKAVSHVTQHNVEGDFVECGVWKGGSSMLAAYTFLSNNSARNMYLYDTYEGMSDPKEEDKDMYGNKADELLNTSDKNDDNSIWCYSGLNEVKQNLYSTEFPKEKLNFIQGKVEETIPAIVPDKIAILRLDTDWFESTYHELVHLYPKLSKNGILIIDDYGYWQGARKAVDQYFGENNIFPLMHRIDNTGRIIQKMS